MIKFNEDYFTLLEPDAPSEEVYYWDDVVRVAYYVRHDSVFYRSADARQVYIIVEHKCGQYLQIPPGSPDWGLFDDNFGKYLHVKSRDRGKLLENPPLERLIDIYVRSAGAGER